MMEMDIKNGSMVIGDDNSIKATENIAKEMQDNAIETDDGKPHLNIEIKE